MDNFLYNFRILDLLKTHVFGFEFLYVYNLTVGTALIFSLEVRLTEIEILNFISICTRTRAHAHTHTHTRERTLNKLNSFQSNIKNDMQKLHNIEAHTFRLLRYRPITHIFKIRFARNKLHCLLFDGVLFYIIKEKK